jgi:hypothetical protein
VVRTRHPIADGRGFAGPLGWGIRQRGRLACVVRRVEQQLSCLRAAPARGLLRGHEAWRKRMKYNLGDYVYPVDLPRRVLCRVSGADRGRTRSGPFQILTLEPLEGPWREWPDTGFLVRLDGDVLPARARDLWRAGAFPARG